MIKIEEGKDVVPFIQISGDDLNTFLTVCRYARQVAPLTGNDYGRSQRLIDWIDQFNFRYELQHTDTLVPISDDKED